MSANADKKMETVEKEWKAKCDDLEERISGVEGKYKALEESCEILEKDITGNKGLQKKARILEDKYEALEKRYETLESKF